MCMIFVWGKQLMIVAEGSRKNTPCSKVRTLGQGGSCNRTEARTQISVRGSFWILPGKCSTESKKSHGSHSRQDTGSTWQCFRCTSGNTPHPISCPRSILIIDHFCRRHAFLSSLASLGVRTILLETCGSGRPPLK